MGDDESDPYLRAWIDEYEAYRRDAPVAEILESVRESEPPDDAHLTG